MAKTVGVDGLAEALDGILKEYNDEIARGTKECVKKVARAGVKALRDVSPKRTGEYAAGWTAKVEEGRLRSTATLYNKKPGLPHLLENGHAIKNGTGRTFGRVPGRPHIAPVEETLAEQFRDEIEVMID